ncbi:MAG: GNAT family N-acetyltransferase [Rhodobacteraceae bacterium]|nr:GNAT family N-acetyltransferase [Paracoccaceae bacterium]
MASTHAAAFNQSRPWTSEEFALLIEDQFCFAVGDPRCFAVIRVVAGEAELLTIATHPDHQRHGLAREVMARWQAAAFRRGAEVAFLEVARDNGPARALYQSCGFVESGMRRAYYARKTGPRVDAIVMTRSLQQA